MIAAPSAKHHPGSEVRTYFIAKERAATMRNDVLRG